MCFFFNYEAPLIFKNIISLNSTHSTLNIGTIAEISPRFSPPNSRTSWVAVTVFPRVPVKLTTEVGSRVYVGFQLLFWCVVEITF